MRHKVKSEFVQIDGKIVMNSMRLQHNLLLTSGFLGLTEGSAEGCVRRGPQSIS
jgi:hypothetical protein